MWFRRSIIFLLLSCYVVKLYKAGHILVCRAHFYAIFLCDEMYQSRLIQIPSDMFCVR